MSAYDTSGVVLREFSRKQKPDLFEKKNTMSGRKHARIGHIIGGHVLFLIPSSVGALGSSSLRSFGPLVLRSFGSSVLWSFGPSVLRSLGSSALRFLGPSAVGSFSLGPSPWVLLLGSFSSGPSPRVLLLGSFSSGSSPWVRGSLGSGGLRSLHPLADMSWQTIRSLVPSCI